MNLFYLHEDPQECATLHCDKHVVKMIIEYAQLMSTARRMLDGEEYEGRTKLNHKIRRWRHPNETMEQTLYKASHINHPTTQWVRESADHYQHLLALWRQLSFEYTFRYKRVHETFRKLHVLLLELPTNIPKNGFREPPQCMPEDVKSESVIEAYHKYYAVYKKDFARWTNRDVPQFML